MVSIRWHGTGIGRAACCGGPISMQYPLVEVLSLLASLLCLQRFGYSPQLAASLVEGELLVVAEAGEQRGRRARGRSANPGAVVRRRPGRWIAIVSFTPMAILAVLYLDWLSASRFAIPYAPLCIDCKRRDERR